MKVLVACEFSGVVRNAFKARGHRAWSCDLLPCLDGGRNHLIRDVRKVLEATSFDLVIAHPPCTYLCSSGLHWNTRDPSRAALTDEALAFVRLFEGCAPRVCIENPVGCISTRWRKPDQIIQPYEFGEDASKKTCLWLEGLSLLQPTKYVEPRIVEGKRRWANQTDSGQNRLGPSPTRGLERAITYQGIAEAMAEQWG